jgi:hypothetical protein
VAPHHLHRLAQAFPHDGGPQDVVALHHLAQGVGECVEACPGVEFQDRRLDVGVLAAVGEQVVEEQAFLEGGQRVDVGDVRRAAVHGGYDQGEFGGGQVGQRQHLGGDRRSVRRDHVPRHVRLDGARRGGQPGRGRGLEERPYGYVGAQDGPDPAREFHGEQ